MDQNVLVENLSQVNLEICVAVQKLFCCPSKRLDTFLLVFVFLFFFFCCCCFFPEKVIAGAGLIYSRFKKLGSSF